MEPICESKRVGLSRPVLELRARTSFNKRCPIQSRVPTLFFKLLDKRPDDQSQKHIFEGGIGQVWSQAPFEIQFDLHIESHVATVGADFSRRAALLGEQLATGLVREIRALPVESKPQQLEVAFSQGLLQGVTCCVHVSGRRVECRLKAAGALQRSILKTVRSRLARQLSGAGLCLRSFEVER